MKTCPGCFSSFDLDALPSVTTQLRQTATIPAGVQVDIKCPRCGKLLRRVIDGDEVGARYKDERAKHQAVKVAKAAEKEERAAPAKATKARSTK